MKKLYFVMALLIVASMILTACAPATPATIIVNAPVEEPAWSYKILADHSESAPDGSFTTTVTIWAKPELEIGNPVLKWDDGFQTKLEWSKESLPFNGHPISEAVLVVDGIEHKDLFGYSAENTEDGGFIVRIP